MARREFHFTDGTSDTFWAIALHHTTFTLHFGQQGTAGQQQTQEFETPQAAAVAYEQAIAEILQQGYVEVQPGNLLHHALDRIKQCIQQQAPEIVRHFQPGLSAAEIATILASVPFVLPDEVHDLFRWHNGTDIHQPLGLLPSYLFLSLEECLAEYRQTLEIYATMPGIDDWERLYNPRWFPIFCDEGNYYVVPGADRPQAAASVLDKFSEDPDARVLFSNLTQMMQAIAECWESGIYRIQQTDSGYGYVTEDDATAANRIWLKYQAHRATYVDELLAGNADTLTPAQRQTAYQALVDTHHPEALRILQHALQDTIRHDVEQCYPLIYLVGWLRSPQAASTLLPYLNHENSRIRFAVVSSLVWAIGDEVLQRTPDLAQWVGPTITMAQETTHFLGLRDVILLLGMMGGRQAHNFLISLLDPASTGLLRQEIQLATIRALPYLRDPSVAEVLYQLAWEDADPFVCLAAGHTLHSMGDKRGLEILIQLIEADLPSISDAARRVLNAALDGISE